MPRIQEGGGLWGARLLRFTTLPSTNRWALRNARRCRHGDVILADHQSAGRGRFDRHWITPPGLALTLSVCIRPDPAPIAVDPRLTQWTALAVVHALAAWTVKARVEWPNDVVVAGAKIAGILAESLPSTTGLVIGMGINVNQTPDDLPAAGLRRPATSMAIELGRILDLDAVRKTLLDRFEASCRQAHAHPEALPRAWRDYDGLLGREIDVDSGTLHLRGRADGVDKSGRLRLAAPDGTRYALWSGDVSAVRNGATKRLP